MHFLYKNVFSAGIASTQEKKMPIYKRNGLWHWRKSIDGIMLFRSTKTDDKKLAVGADLKLTHRADPNLTQGGVLHS